MIETNALNYHLHFVKDGCAQKNVNHVHRIVNKTNKKEPLLIIRKAKFRMHHQIHFNPFNKIHIYIFTFARGAEPIEPEQYFSQTVVDNKSK